jgi:protein arginine kinase activator
MNDKDEDLEQQHPDRPLECSECRKPISVHYTEIIGDTITHIGMCNECPQLQRRLKGSPHDEAAASTGISYKGLMCGECGTTLDELRVSRLVGCSNCYEVFGDLIVEELLKSNKISQAITKKKSVPLHVGRSPGEAQEISPSLRLIALNEALEETLRREDYEQAAWLRDQIKAITEDKEDKDAAKE